jgi:CPA1 family monovalent cation:H+ antiporter
MNNEILISLAGIGVLGIACQWLAWWAKLPAILFLLLCGLVVGPVTGILKPDDLFGSLLFPIVSLSVAIILFEGSLTLRMDEIKGSGSVVRNLISVGALITWLVTAAATYFMLAFPFEIALLFGAVVVVTGPTVIMPMIRTVRPNAKIANILRWEGIAIDPLGALLAVLVFDFIISRQSGNAFTSVALAFGGIVLLGTLIGIVAAWLLGLVLRRHYVPEYLRNVLTLTLVFAVYAFADFIEHESGLLAVTIMGMTLANMDDTNIDDILDFKESLSVLLISGLFIILAARIEFYQFNQIGWQAISILIVIMLLARPLAVWISSIGSDLSFNEKFLISWIGPRGIVAAAVASVFALRLEEAGYPDAVFLVPLTFLVIIGTVVIQSATAKQFAIWLNVREPAPDGVLIIGAGNVARAIGKAIQDHNFKVVLTDSNWENTSFARMESLITYYGNPISEHAERHLDLVGVGRMLAMSGRGNLDTLASLRFRADFGQKGVYELKTTRENIIDDKHKISTRHRGYQLFGDDVTHGVLASWLRNGAEIRSTQLSDAFNFTQYMKKYEGHIIPLFAIDKKRRLHFFVVEKTFKPESDWIVASLIQPKKVNSE